MLQKYHYNNLETVYCKPIAAKYPEVVKHLRKEKNSIREIAKLTGVSVSTIQRVKKSLN